MKLSMSSITWDRSESPDPSTNMFYEGFIRVRVKERIITVPGQAIGQGSGPRAWVVTCGGGNSLQTPPKKLLGAGVSKF